MSTTSKNILDQLSKLVIGKEQQLKLVLSCILADGHLLLEDLPGMGKTTLAQGLSRSLGLDYQRLQCTSDMLPSDILGVSIFNQKEELFSFKKGPIFTQFLLADELNRASPKAQSALLESMEEYTVSIDGTIYKLPEPFVVIATQNPSHQMGTYPLPESQLDRFLMRVSLGYPNETTEKKLIKGENPRSQIKSIQAACTLDELNSMKQAVCEVHLTPALIDYIYRLVAKSRETQEITCGLSPRGSLAISKAAQAWAYLEQRDYVLPEDVQMVFPSVAEHRLKSNESHTSDLGNKTLSRSILESVDVVLG